MKSVDMIIVPTAREAAVGYATKVADILHTDMLTIRNRSVADARNKGLQVAETCGWSNIMFLDDDIRIQPEQIVDAARMLRDTQAVAFTARDFPDNSTVRHAQRMSGVNVPVFPGGGAMLVNMQALPEGKRFPDIYNDDWFFMHGLEVIPGGDVSQLPYDPFIPGRAGREEFGDLIAEAVKDHDMTDDQGFWAGKIQERSCFLSSLNVTGAAAASVAEAKSVLAAVNVWDIISFIRGCRYG